MQDVDVSIIIVSYNTCDLTLDCIRSVYAQTIASCEVIVIDNNSTDGSPEAIANEFPQVIMIANHDNRGFAAANNQGMEIARGRYILLLNPDTLIRENAIDKCLEYTDANAEIGILGCQVFGADNYRQSTCFHPPTLRGTIYSLFIPVALSRRSRILGRGRYIGNNWSQVQDVAVIAGCFMFVRHEILERVGLMDPNYFMYQEEVDWCYRTIRAGWRIVYYPEAWITHYGGQSADQYSEEMLILQTKSRLYFMRKHYGKKTAALANFVLLIHNLIRVPFVWLVKILPSSTSIGRHLTITVLFRRIIFHVRAILHLDDVISYNA